MRGALDSGDLSATSAAAREATAQVAAATNEVAEGAGQTASLTSSADHSMGELGRAIAEIAQGSQETANTVSRMSVSAARVSEAAESIDQQALLAQGEAMAATMAGLREIQRVVESAAEKVRQMVRDSQDIGNIVVTIEDIAGQTSLLALNTQIEAARAGDQGRGFAAVADEVRKLADRSARSTKEIAELIAMVQEGSSQAVRAMGEGSDRVSGGVGVAQQAEEVIQRLRASVEAMGNQVEAISASGHDLAEAAGEMVEQVERVSAVVEQSSASTEEMAASSAGVSDSLGSVSAVAEQASAAAEEVAASTQELTVRVGEVETTAAALGRMAADLQTIAYQFCLSRDEDESEMIDAFRRAHLRLVDRLGGMEAGTEKLREEDVNSHHSCVLGQWYYGRGTHELTGVREFAAIEEPHQRLQAVAGQAVSAHVKGDRRSRESAQAEARRLPRAVVQALDALESRLGRRDSYSEPEHAGVVG